MTIRDTTNDMSLDDIDVLWIASSADFSWYRLFSLPEPANQDLSSKLSLFKIQVFADQAVKDTFRVFFLLSRSTHCDDDPLLFIANYGPHTRPCTIISHFGDVNLGTVCCESVSQVVEFESL